MKTLISTFIAIFVTIVAMQIPTYACAGKDADEAYAERLEFVQLDIALSEEIQKFIWDLCEENNIAFELVIALIEVESTFRSRLVSHSNYGLMQINIVNHRRLKSELGITNFLDPKQNITAGVFMLTELFERYTDTSMVLMAYNHGDAGAKRLWDRKIYETKYTRKVFAAQDKYTKITIEARDEKKQMSQKSQKLVISTKHRKIMV